MNANPNLTEEELKHLSEKYSVLELHIKNRGMHRGHIFQESITGKWYLATAKILHYGNSASADQIYFELSEIEKIGPPEIKDNPA